jgi:hypothetical protein
VISATDAGTLAATATDGSVVNGPADSDGNSTRRPGS